LSRRLSQKGFIVLKGMNGKQRFLTALASGKADVTPVGIDYLSLYLAERTEHLYVEAYRPRLERLGRVRIDPDEDVQIRASATLQAYDCFQERHDWLSVFGAPAPEVLRQQELLLEEGKVFELDHGSGTRRQMLLSGQEQKTEEMRDTFERMRTGRIEKSDTDSLLAERRVRKRIVRGDMRLVQAIVREKGDDTFIYTGAAAPFWSVYGLIGFESMMTALHDAPSTLLLLMDGLLEGALEDAQAFKDAGGHGLRVEECLASADMISPRAFERFVWPYEERLFAQLRRMGLKTILYFCGDVMSRLPALRQLPIDALMVEESKKNFSIDIAEVRSAVGPELCLLGNVDAYAVVQKGTEAELAAEVARQFRVAGADGAFIAGVGSPLPLDTPPERADLLIRCARQHRPGQ
jgi:hypothetical protein